MRLHRSRVLGILLTIVLSAMGALAQRGGGNQPAYMQEARQLMREGKLDGALAVYERELKAAPDSAALHNAAGSVLDLLGRTKEARVHFQKAIDLAPSPEAKYGGWRAMAMSFAFDNDCANTWKYEKLAYDWDVQRGDYYQQGERTNEAARVCIEAGDLDTAEKLYRLGSEVGVKEPNISEARKALWQFRLDHALARLAARRGKHAEAAKYVAAARTTLDSNAEMAKDQEQYFPYLTGYVALYAGKTEEAIAELKKANQNDAFIQCLLGMAYEKKGDVATAKEYYTKAAAVTGHNPPAAFGKPFATKKLASL